MAVCAFVIVSGVRNPEGRDLNCSCSPELAEIIHGTECQIS